MKNYWFSFSFRGENKGVCLVQAETPEEALLKTFELEIHPENDDIAAFELENLEGEDSRLEFDRLYSSQEMEELGYPAKGYTH